MKVKYLFFAGLVSMMAWSCSDDELQGGGNDKPTDAKTYMEISINMPAATRTATPEQGEEEGQKVENYVNSVLILAVEAISEDNKNFEEGQLVFAKVANNDAIRTAGGVSKVTFENLPNTLKTERTEEANKGGYYIYAFVNPTKEIIEHYPTGLPTDWKDLKNKFIAAADDDVYDFIEKMTFKGYKDKFNPTTTTIADGTIDEEFGHFLMTDTSMDNVGYDETSPVKVKKVFYFKDGESSGTHVLQASTNVERAVARLDYKANGDNKFTLSGSNGIEKPVDGKSLDITLTDYCVMNVAKKFYDLKRVTSDGQQGSENTWIYGGAEVNDNYVVDADWKTKMTWEWDKEKIASELFYTPLNGENEDLKGNRYISLNTTLFDDNDVNWNGGSSPTTNNNSDYKALCYCTENTIFGKDNQIHGLTTAIVFKAEISGEFVEGGTTALYRYSNTIYNTWEKVATAYNLAQGTTLATNSDDAYYKSFEGEGENAGKTPEITKWPVSDRKATCYYTYWNRHNDNGNNTEMGIMEFAVVRNNIYKLFVKNILRLGDPEDPTNPEHPIEPGEKDESEKISMEVDVKVLNWAVRKNDITFD